LRNTVTGQTINNVNFVLPCWTCSLELTARQEKTRLFVWKLYQFISSRK